jgi:hypothetical protein
MGLGRPVYLGERYEESAIESEAEAKQLAEYRLANAASYLDRLEIETYLDHTSLEEHQIIGVDLVDGNDHYATGKWIQRVSTVTVDGPRITCRWELTRVISVR